MVGEVRDSETASITIQTAMTGHLVFSTLHTNDSAGGVTRLVDMGIDPFLIASSVEMFIAQRLVRRVCPECKEESKIDASQMPGIPKGMDIRRPVFRGKGCQACNNTGYKGRTGIYELLAVTEPVRRMALQKDSSDLIEARAIELGMKPMHEDGWEKVFQGVTTPEEVQRVTQVAQ
jgi:type II secretory ATPase GspE/PulE/Tfp pilus assembly ATPase PilB-like protein